MENHIDGFVMFMIGSGSKSRNTILSYKQDILKYMSFLKKNNIHDISETNRTLVLTYLFTLQEQGMAPATVSRMLASLRLFYSYIIDSGVDMKDPTINLETPRVLRKSPNILTTSEVELLLSQPKRDNVKGLRDRAMLELLYATGIKVSELINLQISDVNLEARYIKCRTYTHERIVPLGHFAVNAVEEYIEKARGHFLLDEGIGFLFLNRNGTGMSRQGFWKILKHYKNTAGIDKEITPYTLRHSFAIHLLENGADLKAISKMLGHNDISATQVYSDLIDSKIKDSYRLHPRA